MWATRWAPHSHSEASICTFRRQEKSHLRLELRRRRLCVARAIGQYDFSGEVAGVMIGAGWNEVGVLVGKLFALEPPFVQICLLLAAAFSLLMILEGLRATFAVRHDKPARRRPPPIVATPRAIFRSAQNAPAT